MMPDPGSLTKLRREILQLWKESLVLIVASEVRKQPLLLPLFVSASIALSYVRKTLRSRWFKHTFNSLAVTRPRLWMWLIRRPMGHYSLIRSPDLILERGTVRVIKPTQFGLKLTLVWSCTAALLPPLIPAITCLRPGQMWSFLSGQLYH